MPSGYNSNNNRRGGRNINQTNTRSASTSSSSSRQPREQPDPSLPGTVFLAVGESVAASSVSNSHTTSSRDDNAASTETQERRLKHGNARNELQTRYDGHPQLRLLRKSENFVSWNKHRRPDHIPSYTSYFVSPEGEYFPAGRLQDDQGSYHGYDEGLHWYGKKILAEHAAAGRAMDCFKFQDHANNRPYMRYCYDEPVARQSTWLPDHYPDAKERITILVARFQDHSG